MHDVLVAYAAHGRPESEALGQTRSILDAEDAHEEELDDEMQVKREKCQLVEDKEVKIDLDAILDEKIEDETHYRVGKGEEQVESQVDDEHFVQVLALELFTANGLLVV